MSLGFVLQMSQAPYLDMVSKVHLFRGCSEDFLSQIVRFCWIHVSLTSKYSQQHSIHAKFHISGGKIARRILPPWGGYLRARHCGGSNLYRCARMPGINFHQQHFITMILSFFFEEKNR
jgi:hypothetical protein